MAQPVTNGAMGSRTYQNSSMKPWSVCALGQDRIAVQFKSASLAPAVLLLQQHQVLFRLAPAQNPPTRQLHAAGDG
jgi:hypothetical protein